MVLAGAVGLSGVFLVGPAAPAGEAAASAASVSTASVSSAATPVGTLRIAVANVREGTLSSPRADRIAGHDRKAFGRRVMQQGGRLPDVVLLQEALGTAGVMAETLNGFPRARREGARYAVASGTSWRYVTGRCDGARSGRFVVLRSSAVLVNRATVTVHSRGTIRTWGRWGQAVWRTTGRDGHGCTEHAWVRLTVRPPGATARTARVLSTHIAPQGVTLKNRALKVVRAEFDRLARTRPQDLTAIGGDFNLNRCHQSVFSPEPAHCTPRAGHHSLLANGWRDTVRALHPTGPSGVAGVARRIDFLYTRDRPLRAWWDRCYEAYFVHRWKCGDRAVFSSEAAFDRCERRALYYGTPGGGCATWQFRRYYSDHPLLVGTIR